MKPENLSDIVGSDKQHLWHHLTQHKPMQESTDPMVIVEGKGMRVKDINGKRISRCGFRWRLDGQRRLRSRAHC